MLWWSFSILSTSKSCDEIHQIKCPIRRHGKMNVRKIIQSYVTTSLNKTCMEFPMKNVKFTNATGGYRLLVCIRDPEGHLLFMKCGDSIQCRKHETIAYQLYHGTLRLIRTLAHCPPTHQYICVGKLHQTAYELVTRLQYWLMGNICVFVFVMITKMTALAFFVLRSNFHPLNTIS